MYDRTCGQCLLPPKTLVKPMESGLDMRFTRVCTCLPYSQSVLCFECSFSGTPVFLPLKNQHTGSMCIKTSIGVEILNCQVESALKTAM